MQLSVSGAVQGRFVERFACRNHIGGIGAARRFEARVHRQLRKADIDGVYREVGIGNAAKSGAAGDIAAVA